MSNTYVHFPVSLSKPVKFNQKMYININPFINLKLMSVITSLISKRDSNHTLTNLQILLTSVQMLPYLHTFSFTNFINKKSNFDIFFYFCFPFAYLNNYRKMKKRENNETLLQY